MVHEFESVSKRKRRFILNDELEDKIKGLYEKYKDDQQCNRLIADALDPDVKVTLLKVSSKLKLLGLTVSSSKRSRHANGTSAGGLDELSEGKRAMESETNFYNTTNLEGSSSLRKPFFKDHKR